jgi:coenzyme F420-reducing hydrogenase beta subunit
LSKIRKRWFGEEHSELEQRVGICSDRFTCRSLNDEIFENGTNGGTVTALLHYLLENRMVDAVLHAGALHKNSYICHHSIPIISRRPEDTLKGARSKMCTTPLLHVLKDLECNQRVAVVALACHVEGLRKLQVVKDDPELRSLLPALAQRADSLLHNLVFVIGLNCFGNPLYGSVDKMYEKYGIQEEDVIKFCETTKKSLYQLLNEGKDFLWFAGEGCVTRDGKYYRFRWAETLDYTVSMGCMVCPSFILSKEADVSIGLTASEIKHTEYGYNSVFVRHPDLHAVFERMVNEKKLLRRPMWEKHRPRLRKLVEYMFPRRDHINFSHYVTTGQWKQRQSNLYQPVSQGYKGTIMGLERLFLLQTAKKKIFYNHAIKALRDSGKHLPETI